MGARHANWKSHHATQYKRIRHADIPQGEYGPPNVVDASHHVSQGRSQSVNLLEVLIKPSPWNYPKNKIEHRTRL
jgi:hypothetical protein